MPVAPLSFGGRRRSEKAPQGLSVAAPETQRAERSSFDRRGREGQTRQTVWSWTRGRGFSERVASQPTPTELIRVSRASIRRRAANRAQSVLHGAWEGLREHIDQPFLHGAREGLRELIDATAASHKVRPRAVLDRERPGVVGASGDVTHNGARRV